MAGDVEINSIERKRNRTEGEGSTRIKCRFGLPSVHECVRAKKKEEEEEIGYNWNIGVTELGRSRQKPVKRKARGRGIERNRKRNMPERNSECMKDSWK